jgi:hypothetical protein
MPVRFRVYGGDWVTLRERGPREVDLHFGRRAPETAYEDVMSHVRALVMSELKRAQHDGIPCVLFTHGCSTSGRGQRTARSVVRGLMRSAASTPYIIRGECIQHDTAFLARIRL